MNTDKINLWIVGSCLFFAGGVLFYYYGYKNNQVIDASGYILMLIGWVCLFMKSVKGTIVDAPKISYKTDKAGFFRQRIISFFAYVISTGVMLGLMFWLFNMGRKRKDDILQHQPTNTTVAVVDHLEERHGRNTTSYYAVFQYKVNGKIITHEWHENHESDFLVGERFQIKYSVEHPDMFMILEKLP